MAWVQSCEIPHTSIIHCYFFSYYPVIFNCPDRKYPWLNTCHIFFPDNPNLVSYVPVTVQVLDVNDNAPYITTDSALVVCEGSKAGQVSYRLSVLFSMSPYDSFSTCQLPLEPLKPFFLSALFSCPIIFSNLLFHALILSFSSHICMNPHTPMYTNAIDSCINEKHIRFLYDMSDTIKDGFICGSTVFGGS